MLLRLIQTFFSAALHGRRALPFDGSPEVNRTPADIHLEYEDVTLATSDGQRINGWFIPAALEKKKPGTGRVLLFFHGNKGNISHRLPSLFIFHNLGLPQFIIDYRGFGKSTGKPSVLGTLLDAEASWRWLVENRGFRPEQIILSGRSLGGGIAAGLASSVRPGGLILESTFTSLVDLAGDMYPMMPVSWFLPEDYSSIRRIKTVQAPLLVMHSPDDEVVHFKHGQALYDAYEGSSKQFLELQGSHDSGFLDNLPIYVKGLESFLSSLPALSLPDSN